MKAKLLAATGLAAVLAIASCTWLAGRNKHQENNVLAGRYQLVSIADSSTKKPGQVDTLKWFFNALVKDTSSRYINFETDSTLSYETTTKVDSAKYYSDSADKIIYIKIDSLYRPFEVKQVADSIINLFAANDSVYIALRKL